MHPELLSLTVVLALAGTQPVAPPAPPPGAGRLPIEALALPADTRFVLDIDVGRIVASPLYEALGPQPGHAARLQVMDDVRQRLGLDPERDVRRILVAGFAPPSTDTVALLFGQFDGARLARGLTAPPSGATRADVGKSTVYRLQAGKRGPQSLALVSPTCILLGSTPIVEEMIAHPGRRTLAENQALMSLVGRVEGETAFWLVGDGSLLAQLDAKKGTSGIPLGLPPVRQLIATGVADPQPVLSLTADVGDPASARNVADMVRGFVSLLAFSVSAAGGEVRLRCTLTDEQVATLMAAGRSRSQAPASPAQPATPKPGTVVPASPN
jgi:hypothetical protein